MRIASTPLAMAALRRLDPERAHRLALTALRCGAVRPVSVSDDPALSVQAFGLRFSNPIGLAAGFDKDALAAAPLMHIGFGFIEVGTVTRFAQPGNLKPRLFRLTADRAVINRMGFNNSGVAALIDRLGAIRERPVPLGINIGLNKEGGVAERDYKLMVRAVSPFADYIVINVSSPNTPGLRDFQARERLSALLEAASGQDAPRPPLLVKLAPDLDDRGLEEALEVCSSYRIDGVIISNTTLARDPGLESVLAAESGGLSGAPLFRRSTDVLRRAYQCTKGSMTLIGCGGVRTGSDVLEKLEAGATLVQVYTEFAFAGPGLIPRLKSELQEAIGKKGYPSVAEAIGQAAYA